MPGMDMVGAGANVVGGLIQSIAASKAQKEMQQALDSFIQQQKGYRNEAMGVFQPSLEYRGAETAKKQLGEGAAYREGEYARIGEQPTSVTGTGGDERDKAYYGMQGRSRAKLGSYADWQLLQDINGLRTQQQLNKISNFAGGNAALFPARMDDASHSFDELAFFGNLISSVGGSAGSWGQYFGGGGGGGSSGMPQGFGQWNGQQQNSYMNQLAIANALNEIRGPGYYE